MATIGYIAIQCNTLYWFLPQTVIRRLRNVYQILDKMSIPLTYLRYTYIDVLPCYSPFRRQQKREMHASAEQLPVQVHTLSYQKE